MSTIAKIVFTVSTDPHLVVSNELLKLVVESAKLVRQKTNAMKNIENLLTRVAESNTTQQRRRERMRKWRKIRENLGKHLLFSFGFAVVRYRERNDSNFSLCKFLPQSVCKIRFDFLFSHLFTSALGWWETAGREMGKFGILG